MNITFRDRFIYCVLQIVDKLVFAFLGGLFADLNNALEEVSCAPGGEN